MAELDEAKKLLDEAHREDAGQGPPRPLLLRNALRVREGRRGALPEHAQQGPAGAGSRTRTSASRTPIAKRGAKRWLGKHRAKDQCGIDLGGSASATPEPAPDPAPPATPARPPSRPPPTETEAREARQAGAPPTSRPRWPSRRRIRAADASETASDADPNFCNSDATCLVQGSGIPRRVRRMFRKFVTMFAAAAFVTGVADVASADDDAQDRHGRSRRLVLGQGVQEAREGRVGRHERRAESSTSSGTRQAGDEDLMVQKIRSGQLDAAAVTVLGLAQTGVTDILLFQLPGLFTSWAKLDAARDAMKDDFNKHVRGQGLHRPRLGRRRRRQDDERRLRDPPPGGPPGQGRLLLPRATRSRRSSTRPSAGITPKQLSINEVLPALTGGDDQRPHGTAASAPSSSSGARASRTSTPRRSPTSSARSSCRRRASSRCPRSSARSSSGAALESSDRLTKAIRNIDAQAFARMKAVEAHLRARPTPSARSGGTSS